MRRRPRLTLAIGLLAALSGLLVFFHKEPRPGDHTVSTDQPVTGPAHPFSATGRTDEALPSKSQPRSPTPKISEARTRALLHTPIPGSIEFPEQTLPERVEALNRILAAAGINADEARIEVHPSFEVGMQYVCPELILSDSTPIQMLQYITGRTRMCLHTEAGVVYFYDCARSPFRTSPVTPR
jgi:hypothetical protein